MNLEEALEENLRLKGYNNALADMVNDLHRESDELLATVDDLVAFIVHRAPIGPHGLKALRARVDRKPPA